MNDEYYEEGEDDFSDCDHDLLFFPEDGPPLCIRCGEGVDE